MRKVFVLQQIPDHNSGHIFWSHEILGGEKFSLGREKLGPLVGNWDLDYLAPQLAQLTTHQRSKCRFFMRIKETRKLNGDSLHKDTSPLSMNV